MTVLKLKWVHRFKDRHGRLRHYFRRPGYDRVPLPGIPGSAEFMAAYQAALDGEKRQIGKGRLVAGTVSAAVLGYCSSSDFKVLAPATKNTYRRGLEAFARDHGDKPVRSLQAQHIRAIMSAKADKPNAANNFLKHMRLLMRFAVENGLRRDDPTVGIRKVTIKSDGFHTWSEDEIAMFEARWPVGTTQRLAFDLLLHSGQRSADVRQLTKANLDDQLLLVRQQKTREYLQIPIGPQLRASLDTIPEGQVMLLLTSFGRPFTEKGFGNYIKRAAAFAGLPHCSAHGLRKSAATRLAEAGCTEHQIMSITGHKTSKEVMRYTAAARQGLLAEEAMQKVETSRLKGG